MTVMLSAGPPESPVWIEVKTPEGGITPPWRHQIDRLISWERPREFQNLPCGAGLTVGSIPLRTKGLIQVNFRRQSVLKAEGGIVGAPEYPQVRSKKTVWAFVPDDYDVRKWRELNLKPEEMNYRAVCADANEGILGIPSLVCVLDKKKEHLQVAGLTIEESGQLIWGNEKYPDSEKEWYEFKKQVDQDFEAIQGSDSPDRIRAILRKYVPPKEGAGGFYALLDDLHTIKGHNPFAIKVQLASPSLVLGNISDSRGKNKLSESHEMEEIVRKFIALRNRALVEKIREKWDGRIIVCADKPDAASQSAMILTEDINAAFALVFGLENVSLMIHSCEQLQPDALSFLSDGTISGIHLDLFSQPKQIEEKAYASFLAKDDNFLAAGIVPTVSLKDLVQEVIFGGVLQRERDYNVLGLTVSGDSLLQGTSDGEWVAQLYEGDNYRKALVLLYQRLESIVDTVYNNFDDSNRIDRKKLWAKIAVSSSCGTGALDPLMSTAVYDLTRDLSYLVRTTKLGLNYG